MQMLEMSKKVYPWEINNYGGISTDAKNTAIVLKVTDRLIDQAVTYMMLNGFENELKYYEWEIYLTKSKEIPNAFCMPGGKMIITEAMLPIAYDEAGLAAIIGHEIGHAIAHHKAEQFTKNDKKKIWQLAGAAAMIIAGSATGGEVEDIKYITETSLELSEEVMKYVEAKYSRKHEYEADRIGMILMAMAGYDPREAANLWNRMTEYIGDYDMRILSSHPSNKNRIKKAKGKNLTEALAYYNPGNSNPNQRYQALNTPPSGGAGGKTSGKGYSQGFADGQKGKYTVTANSLNVRSAPNTNSNIIGSLKKGTQIEVIEIKSGWARIKYNKSTGYVSAKFISRR